ncbi:hypothetical protein BJY52DRAFT_1406433 [Lactarius psammicola]|nr:hypothetical protein BJY52DRAFT_1406433 [Lactarius psammicola]
MSPASVPLTFGHRIRVFILAEISAVSASAVTFLASIASVGDPIQALDVFEFLSVTRTARQCLRQPFRSARYSEFAGHNKPFVATVIADGFYLSSSFLNVLLYTYMRPDLLPEPSDNLDNRSVTSHPEFAQSRSDLPGSTILGNTRAVDKVPCTRPSPEMFASSVLDDD